MVREMREKLEQNLCHAVPDLTAFVFFVLFVDKLAWHSPDIDAIRSY